ncbi:MAG TPA: xanthine dehydrogenase family protein molybdopterin-binding subunit, partial [Candidatus Limnocylindrales bacterium]
MGESPWRVGGRDRVTGHQAYVADLRVEGALHVKLVTVDAARARIDAIDGSRALALPGVRLVMTPDDLPSPMPRFGPQLRDRPVLADGETRYHGEPVAAVAAETRDIAEEAARLVDVRYEALPAVSTIAAALDPDSPLVLEPSIRVDDELGDTNTLREHRYVWGDLPASEREAAVVVEGTYAFPMVTQFAIEPHAFMAAPDGDGMQIWSSIQHPYWLQRVIASLLGLPLAKVRVFAPDPGGGFGGKQHAKYEPLLAFMARRANRPMRLVLTLEETFQAVRRAASEVRMRSGFRADGTFVFREVEANYLVGAYADIADRVVAKGSYTSAGPYKIPAVTIVARSLLSHTVPSTAFRGFGNPQQIWAGESNLDEAAQRLGIDPMEIRLRNLARRGDPFLPDDLPADGEWADTVKAAARRIGWGEPVPKGRGRGIAVGLKEGPTTGLSYSTVRLLADGSIVVNAGTSDMGQGARTIFAQIAAQELGAPVDWVTVVMGDTAVVPYDQQTSASRSSVLMGNAVLLACREIQARLRTMAATLEGVDADEVTVDMGEVRIGDRVFPVLDVLTRGLGRLGGELIGVGEFRKEAQPEHPLGGTAAFYEFNCTAVEVSVDEDTGDVTVERHVTASDVGRALHPGQVRGQDEGAAVMGL